MYIQRNVYFKELAYVFVEDWQSQNLMREASSLEIYERAGVKFKFKGNLLMNQRSDVAKEVQRKSSEFPLAQERSAFCSSQAFS